jgi:polysaccharide biosynthesis transport protein
LERRPRYRAVRSASCAIFVEIAEKENCPMTTLPQTTGTRFPRAGGRAPNIPGPVQSGLPAGPGGNTLTAGDIIRVLRANALLTVVMLVLSLAAGWGIYTAMAKYAPSYTATAQLKVQTPSLIDLKNPGAASIISNASAPLEVRMQTQANILQNASLWRQVLEDAQSPVRKTQWFENFVVTGANGTPKLDMNAALKDLRNRIGVIVFKNSELIQIAVSANTSADAVELLNEIVRVHIENENRINGEARNGEESTLNTLKARTEARISISSNKINELNKALNWSNNTGGPVVTQMELNGLMTERAKALSELNESKSFLDSTEKTLEDGGVPASIQMQMDNDPRLATLRNQLDNSDTQYQVEKSKNGESSRLAKELVVQIDTLKKKVADREDELRNQVAGSLVQNLQSAVDKGMAAVADYDQRVAKVSELLRDYNRNMDERASEERVLSLLTEKRKSIEDKLDNITANSFNAENRATVRKMYVEEPTGMSSPNLPVTMLLSGVVGLGLALGIAFLRELMDTSIRSPRDITRVGQMNLLGMIPHEDDDPQAAGSELSLVISQAPHSVIAEQFRHVRTRLQHAASLDTTRSLLVTSPGPGDGKTTVACNIAAGLALNGRKILLVDANFRRPQIHSVFGLTNDVGFGSVLGQQASIETAVRKTNVPNLDVLTTGPRPANPTELLESALLTEFIDRALEEYDHVVFDSGPILLVSETVALAPRVDGVITVVKARANSRGLLQRMRDALRQLKSEHIGVVLNGVRTQGGGYYGRNIKTYYTYQSAGN